MDLRSMSNFKGVEDRFKGITVDSNNEECSIEEFPKKLEGLFLIFIVIFLKF